MHKLAIDRALISVRKEATTARQALENNNPTGVLTALQMIKEEVEMIQREIESPAKTKGVQNGS